MSRALIAMAVAVLLASTALLSTAPVADGATTCGMRNVVRDIAGPSLVEGGS